MEIEHHSAIAQHAVIRLRDGRVLSPGPRWRRRVVRALLTRAEPYGLISFRLVDTHLHLLIAADQRATSQLARRVEIALQLRRRPAPGFSPVYVKPVASQEHLRSVFDYLLRQEAKHGVDTDPEHEGGILPDLIGARLLGSYAIPTVRALLPRLTRERLLAVAGLGDVQPSDGPLDDLGEATAAAANLTSLGARTTEAFAARSAAVQVAANRLTGPALATMLHTSARTIRRNRTAPAAPELVGAIRLQLGLRRSARR